MKQLFTLSLILSVFTLSAQTYETDALRIEAEKQLQEKSTSSNSKQNVEGVYVVEKKVALNPNDLKNTFQLTQIEAKDYSSKHSNEEMTQFNKESVEEFAKTDIRISANYDKMFFISKETSEYSIKEIQLVNNELQYVNCTKCNSSFKIVLNDENYLILETPSQDEGTYFMTRLIFKK